MTNDLNASIYHAVPGGTDLVRWFGAVPSFHDAEILSLHLRSKSESVLCVHVSKLNNENGYFVVDQQAVVTFNLEGILDLQLDGFTAQNVIGGLTLRRAVDRPDRSDYLSDNPLPEDIEIELEHCYGLFGLIRARSVAISFEPGQPSAGN